MEDKQRMKKKTTQHNYKIDQTNAEIPCLSLSLTESKADFITKNIYLESKGWNIQEAMGGMNYLIDQYNKIQKKNKKGDV